MLKFVLALAVMTSAMSPMVSGQVVEGVLVDRGARFDAARLEQLVAPIALYPDSLLLQVFMASTYPLEVVEADRFVKANPGLSQQTLETSLVGQNWDPSVKVLAGFPDVLRRLSENLDWSRDLGDAFLAQRAELLDAVQRMRARASEAGTLTSTEQHTVTTQADRIIVIESANPSVVYVPTYSPYRVYGNWSYPYYRYPSAYGWGGYSGGGLSFGIGLGFGDWLWGRPSWGWGQSSFWVDANRYNQFNRRYGHGWSDRDYVRGDRFDWRHHHEHRRGVRYRDPEVSRQYGGGSDDWRLSRDSARGFEVAPAPRRDVRAGVNGAQNGNLPSNVSPRLDRREPSRTERQVSPRINNPPVNVPPRVDRKESPRIERQTAPRIETPKSDPRVNPAPQPNARSRTTWSGSRNPALDRAATERGSKSRAVAPRTNSGSNQKAPANRGRPQETNDGRKDRKE